MENEESNLVNLQNQISNLRDKMLSVSKPYEPKKPSEPRYRNAIEPIFVSGSFFLSLIISFAVPAYFQWIFFNGEGILFSVIFSVVFSILIRYLNYSKEIKFYKRQISTNTELKINYEKAQIDYETQMKSYGDNLERYNKAQFVNSKFQTEIDEIQQKIISLKLQSLRRNSSKSNENIKTEITEFTEFSKSAETPNVFCPKCGCKFIFNKDSNGKITGGLSGAVAGALMGGKIGIAMGPLGAIGGTIPGAILGGMFGNSIGKKIDDPKCPKCETTFSF